MDRLNTQRGEIMRRPKFACESDYPVSAEWRAESEFPTPRGIASPPYFSPDYTSLRCIELYCTRKLGRIFYYAKYQRYFVSDVIPPR